MNLSDSLIDTTSRHLGAAVTAVLFAALPWPPAPALGAAAPPSSTAGDAGPPPGEFVGHWQGTLEVGGTSLRIVFHIQASDGEAECLAATLDSPDQGANGIPVETVTVKEDSLRLDVAAAGAVYVGRLTAGGTTIEGERRQTGTALPLTIERVEEGRPADGEGEEETRRPQDPEPPHPYLEEEVEIDVPETDVRLAGTLTRPSGASPAPAVVLVSGSGAQDRDGTLAGHRPFLVLSDHPARRGLAVLRTDDRGVGGSTGSIFGSTMGDRARDVLAAVRFPRRQPGIDRERVGVPGHSEGGWIISRAAVEAPDEIAFAVLMAGPAQSPLSLLRSQRRALSSAGGAKRRGSPPSMPSSTATSTSSSPPRTPRRRGPG